MALDISVGSYALGNNIDKFEIEQESRLEPVPVPRREGYLTDEAYSTGMRLLMGGTIYNDDSDDTRTTLNALKNAFSKGKKTITLYDDRELIAQKEYFRSSYVDADLRRVQWEASMLSDDFGFRAVNPTVTTATITTSPSTSTSTNDGNLDADAVIRMTPGSVAIASGVRIDNLTNGKFFTYNTTITTGDYVEIDTENLTVVDSAGANKIANFQGDFFKLAAGANQIKYTGTTSSAVVNLTYRSKYDGP